MRYVLIAVLLVVMAFLVMDFNSRTAELSRLTSEHAVVKSELDNSAGTRAALEEQIAYATSEAAVYEWAYENHMVRPGDMRIIPVQIEASTPVPTPMPITVVAEANNIDRWLSLFVDSGVSRLTP